MVQQVTRRKAPGLYVQPNKLTIPEGALLEAREVDILREGVYSKRRGFDFFIGAIPWGVADALLEYQKHLVLHAGETVAYDETGDGSSVVGWPGSHQAPDGVRMQGLEAAKNFHFTTQAGVEVADGYGGTPRRAGMPQGLDIGAVLTGAGGGFFPPDSKVGYRVVFLKKDRNGNQVAGAASFPDELANPAPADVTLEYAGGTVTVTHAAHGYGEGDLIEITGPSDPLFEDGPHIVHVVDADTYTYTVEGAPAATGTAKAGKRFNVAVDLTLPVEVQAGDFLELYRTQASASEDTAPGDRYLLVSRVPIAAGDVTAGHVAYTDTADDALLGADLESNAQVNGQSQAPDRPPWARFICQWKDFTWYAHTRQPQQLQLQLTGVTALVDYASSVTITTGGTQRTYTSAPTEDAVGGRFQRFTGETTQAENIRKTAKSFCRVVNRMSGGLLDAFYTSGVQDAPGKILLRQRLLAQPAFYVTASDSTTGSVWSPVLPTAGSSVASDDTYKRNGLYNSRSGRPEAVPVSNVWQVGSDLRAITGIQPLNDCILIFTEGGTWYLSGETDGGAGKSFRLEQLAPNLILKAPGSLVGLDDHAFGVFTQGVCRVSSAGAAIVSRQIETDLLRRFQFPGFNDITFAAPYESDHKYMLFTQGGSNDNEAKLVWVYSTLENTWAGPWKRPSKAARVLHEGDNRLYLARLDAWISAERKSYSKSGRDFMDESFDATVTAHGLAVDPLTGESVTTVTVTYTEPEQLGLGWRWDQGYYFGEVTAIADLGGGSYRLTLSRLTTAAGGACTLSQPIDMQLKYVIDEGNAAVQKQGTELQIYFDDPPPARNWIGFLSDAAPTPTWLEDPVLLTRHSGWGTAPWGGSSWGETTGGSGDPLRTRIARDHQRHRVMHVLYRNRSAGQAVHLLQMSLNARVVSTVTTKR